MIENSGPEVAKDCTGNIRYLFEPGSIAIIGAFGNVGKIGYNLLKNIKDGGFRSKIYPINPAGGEIEEIHVYKSILDIDGEIDLACVTPPLI